MLRVLVLCLSILGVMATAAAASEPDWRAWALEGRKLHALAGQIYNPHQGKLMDLADETLSSQPGGFIQLNSSGAWFLPEGIVLLGEVHDNPAHHQVRAWLIAQTARFRLQTRPAVVFEQIRTDQQPALDQFKALDGRPATAAELLGLLQWDKSGWPPAEIYRPLFDAVIAARLPILPGEPPRDRVRALARGGASSVSAEERARLQLDEPLPATLAEALSRELAESHCGALPPQAIPGMARAQHYRDAHLADALLNAAQSQGGGAILIAGNGHVRSDRGVPWHIRQRAPDVRLTSAVLAEVEEGKTDPAEYVPRDPEGKPAADLVIFTPKAERGDPCQSLTKNKR